MYIWRQVVSLQWCNGSKSLLSGRFGYPYGRPGDSFCIRETPGLSGRVGMNVLVFYQTNDWNILLQRYCSELASQAFVSSAKIQGCRTWNVSITARVNSLLVIRNWLMTPGLSFRTTKTKTRVFVFVLRKLRPPVFVFVLRKLRPSIKSRILDVPWA